MLYNIYPTRDGKMNKYEIAEEIITKRFDKNDENYALYYLSCYGLLDKFGDKYLSLIEELFATCEFYIGNKHLKQLMDEVDNTNEIINKHPYMIASCCPGIIVALDKSTNKLKIVKQKPKMFYSKTSNNANINLIATTHELAHIVKGLKNSLSILPDNKEVFIRNGFFIEFFETDGNNIYTKQLNYIFDEVINVLQTSDMMNAIKKIDKTKLENNVLEFFETLDLTTLDKPYGYSDFTNLVEPLWKNNKFKNLIEESIVEGNLEYVNKNLGNYFITDISSILEIIATTNISKKEIDKEFKRVKKIIYSYNKRNN